MDTETGHKNCKNRTKKGPDISRARKANVRCPAGHFAGHYAPPDMSGFCVRAQQQHTARILDMVGLNRRTMERMRRGVEGRNKA